MEIVLVLFIIVCFFILSKSLLIRLIKPVTNKQKERIKSDEFYKNAQKKTFKDKMKDLANKLPSKELMDDKMLELDKKIDRLQLETSAKEVRGLQTLYFLAVFAVSCVLGIMFGINIFIVGVVIAIITWNYPVAKIDSQIKKRNRAVEAELPKLFSVLYYVYKRTPNASLKEKVQNYIKTSGDLFYKEMMIFINDCRSGEVYALKQFKKRVPIPIVMRFCDIMENRIVGYDNVNVMQNFKVELDQKMILKSEDLIKETDKKVNAIIQGSVWISLFLIMTVFFIAQIIAAFNS